MPTLATSSLSVKDPVEEESKLQRSYAIKAEILVYSMLVMKNSKDFTQHHERIEKLLGAYKTSVSDKLPTGI